MAAFPGILQSPFVVATDSKPAALVSGTLPLIAIATNPIVRRKRPPEPERPKFKAVPWPQLDCMRQGISPEDRELCEAYCHMQGKPCAVSCRRTWYRGHCFVEGGCADSAEECGFLDDIELATPENV